MTRYIEMPESARSLARPKQPWSRYAEEIAALLAGKTIFVPEWNHRPEGAAIRTAILLRSHGTKRPAIRRTTIDGKTGLLMWLEDKA